MNKIEKKYIFPSEVVAGVLALLEREGVNTIPTEKAKIHSVFYKMREQDLGVLRDFRFDIRGLFPYSVTLEQAISNLATSLLLERNNPRLNAYLITKRLKTYFEKYVKPELSDEELEQLQKISKEVQSILSPSSAPAI